MEIFSGLLIGTALAMDSFSVAIAAGTGMKKIKFSQSLLIAGYFGFFQWLMTFLGWYGGLFFNDILRQVDHWIALGILVIIGGKMIYESFQKDAESGFSFGHKILLFLAIATSIDAFGVGLSYALLDKPIMLNSVIIGLVAFFFSYAGVYLGKYFHHLLKKKMEFLGGLILIGIGFKIALDHGVF